MDLRFFASSLWRREELALPTATSRPNNSLQPPNITFTTITINTTITTMLSSLRTVARRTAVPTVGAVRNLNVHEYISMELMNAHDIATPHGYVASTPEEAEHIYNTMFCKREYCTFKVLTVQSSRP